MIGVLPVTLICEIVLAAAVIALRFDEIFAAVSVIVTLFCVAIFASNGDISA